MKRISVLSVLFFGLSFASFAQPEHRISFGAGIFSQGFMHELSEELTEYDRLIPYFGNENVVEYTEEKFRSFPINLNLHYEWILSRHWSVGCCLGYDYLRMKQTTNVYTKETWIDSWGMKRNHRCATEYGELRRHIFYLMPESSFYWFRRQKFAMYSKFSVGVRFNFEKREFFSSRRNTNEYKESHVYFQGSPVCLEAGRKNVRFFAEFGYGAQGMGQMGIKYTFKNEAKE